MRGCVGEDAVVAVEWLASGDPRWCVRVVDTSTSTVTEVAPELVDWIDEERALFQSGGHPLPGRELAAS